MAPRILRVLFPLLALAACTGSKEEPKPAPADESGGRILTGGGAETELARALEQGRLASATAEAPADAGNPARGGESREGRVYRGPGDRLVDELPPGAVLGTPPPAATPPPALDDQEADRAVLGARARMRPPEEEELSHQGELQDLAKAQASGQAWKREGKRPAFARVYVGDGNSLELVRMRITVTIDGPRARTVVDHVFRNPHDQRLEGTFEYPLPAGASACYYAMFLSGEQREIPPFFASELPSGVLADMPPEQMARTVDAERWGPLREARVVSRQQARKVYEEVVRGNVDPALLEYAGGNTFQGRVFPIEPQGLNRVIVAYEETLEGTDKGLRYRFPLPDCPLELLAIAASLEAEAVKGDTWSPAAGAVRKVAAGRIVWEQAWERTRGPGGEALLGFEPADARVQAIAGPGLAAGRSCFFARLRPELPQAEAGTGASSALFLLDTSLSEEPDRFNVSRALLRRILESDERIERFNVLCFDVGAWWLAPGGWLGNDAAGRKQALDALGGVLLEGATDLGAALDLAARARWPGMEGDVDLFLLTDGQVNWGEREPERMLAAFEASFPGKARFFCYRTGLGAENLELFGCLTRAGGGIFNVFTEEQAAAAARAHRRACLVLDSVAVRTAGGEAGDLLVAGRQAALFPGGELLLAGSFEKAGPAEATVRGRLAGEARTFRFPLALGGGSELAARALAEIAVAQLLELGDPEPEKLAVALAQRYRIGSRATSFLVLERDQDYVQFGVEEQAKALSAGDLGEYLAARRTAWLGPASKAERFRRNLAGLEFAAAGKAEVEGLLGLLSEADLALPTGPDPGPRPPERSLAPRGYLEARNAQPRKPDPHLEEAARRAGEGQAFLGLRALSNLVELFPGRSDAGRLAGYRLLSMGLPGPAAQVFESVREGRPFEPHSYRDLARSLELSGNYALAALNYELLLAGAWHARFHDSLAVIARDEYCRLMQEALRRKAVSVPVAERFGARLEVLHQGTGPADLRATISWNTDGTDVDLWVVEPGGEACGYNHRETKSGGRLLDDLTQGYGPERYEIRDAPAGEYVVLIHYYAANPNLLAGETHVDVLVTLRAGRQDEEQRRFHVVLSRAKQGYEVCRVRP